MFELTPKEKEHAKTIGCGNLFCGIIGAVVGVGLIFAVVYLWLIPLTDKRSTLQETQCIPTILPGSVVWSYNVTVGGGIKTYIFTQDTSFTHYTNRPCWYDKIQPDAGVRFDDLYYQRNGAVATLSAICAFTAFSLGAGLLRYGRAEEYALWEKQRANGYLYRV